MKGISELNYSVQNPTGDEYLIVNQYGSGGYKSYKVTLRKLKEFLHETSNLITEDGIDIALCDGNDTLIAYN
jgi:hypothetical protein